MRSRVELWYDLVHGRPSTYLTYQLGLKRTIPKGVAAACASSALSIRPITLQFSFFFLFLLLEVTYHLRLYHLLLGSWNLPLHAGATVSNLMEASMIHCLMLGLRIR